MEMIIFRVGQNGTVVIIVIIHCWAVVLDYIKCVQDISPLSNVW